MLNNPMVPYVAPFVAFLLFIQLPPADPTIYPWAYGAVIIVVGILTVFLLRGRNLIAPHWRIAPGIVFGVIGIVLWIGLTHWRIEDVLLPYLPEWLQPESRASFNPVDSIPHTAGLAAFLGIRLIGIAVLVPVVEELFWRGFLLRWINAKEWQDEPMGQFSLSSFLWVVVLFALAHPEWLAAAAWCALINLLFYWKKDLWNCVVAHSVSNALLMVYVLQTGNWQLW